MGATTTAWKTVGWEDSDPVFYARVVVDDAGTRRYLLQSDLTSISCSVFDRGTIVGTATTITISTSVYDTLQTGTVWTQDTNGDSTGYNFRVQLAAASFPTGDKTYTVEFKFTTTGSKVYWLVYEHLARAVSTS